MRIVVLFGSEMGTAEKVAEAVAEELNEHQITVFDMSEFDITELDPEIFHIIVCSTYGEGDLPTGAEPFFEALEAHRPDLTALRFAVFGLGDSVYDNTFNRGGEIAAAKLTALGGVQLGDHARHDASTEIKPAAMGREWSRTLPLESITLAPA
ncbi:flavodoxin domain-containing protein [Nocardia sp. NBC_01329]|uniref:flavodoxin domain-containing protein n=1 Tax=Nocardia sp. NBC_01329 TaxID=2903594 RepID=UPI002E15C504|nr:flavodoxin domain-containing protein [Nocardia sp. NBC_01329]